MGSRIRLVIAGVVLVVLLVALNMLSGLALRGARIDATQGKMFTLTAGSRAIARAAEEPITLKFYYSAKLAQGRPEIQSYAQRVREMLEEYARIGGGRVRLEVIDPEPFSELEDAAVAAGLTGVPLNTAGDALYLGLVGTNSIDTKETIAFFDPRKERFLEYNITKMMYSLSHPTRRVVGLISGLPLEGGFSMDPRTRQPTQTPPWQVLGEIKGAFDVRNLGDAAVVPDDVSVLMVVHPKGLSEQTLFAIDQYVLRGGAAMIFVDPMCEADQAPGPTGMPERSASGLPVLFDAWGIEVPGEVLAADDTLAEPVLIRIGNRPEQVTYMVWLGCDQRSLSREDAVTGNLGKVNFGTSGIVRVKADAKDRALLTPLVLTTPRAMEMPADAIGFPPDPKALARKYVAGKEALTLAARLSGRVKSAFPGGRPAPANSDAAAAKPPEGEVLAESRKDLNVIVVTDCDVLADAMWARQQNLFGQTALVKLADNADLVLGALDNLSGGTDLVSVRARQESSRPFTTVQDMERRAQQRYLVEEEALNAKKTETEQRLVELQGGKAQGGSLVLTPEQEAEVEKFRAELLDTRKKLREVKKGLRDDIDRLGVQLKLINTALVPALVALFAVGLAFYRRSRRAESVAMAAKENKS